MTIAASPPGLQPEEYLEIETAVAASRRGRFFLAEHARRVRSAESARMLAAIERLEARLEAQQALAPADAFTLADRLNELSWSLRESGVEDFVCGKIDALAREFRGAGPAPERPASGSDSAPEPAPPAAPAPQTPPSAIAAEEVAAEAAELSAPATESGAPRPDPRLAALSWLDRLPLIDRFALFA